MVEHERTLFMKKQKVFFILIQIFLIVILACATLEAQGTPPAPSAPETAPAVKEDAPPSAETKVDRGPSGRSTARSSGRKIFVLRLRNPPRLRSHPLRPGHLLRFLHLCRHLCRHPCRPGPRPRLLRPHLRERGGRGSSSSLIMPTSTR